MCYNEFEWQKRTRKHHTGVDGWHTGKLTALLRVVKVIGEDQSICSMSSDENRRNQEGSKQRG
jgi:hypothetical protein